MKTILITYLFLFCFLLTGKAQTQQEVSYFPLQDVKLLESPFLQAQQTDLHYIMAMEPDRLLAPFLREAGLTPKAPSYTNWENTGLDGHIGGHYISALSMMYAATGDTAIYNRLNYMLNELHRAQQAVGTGFIGGTPEACNFGKKLKPGISVPEVSTSMANGYPYTIYTRLMPDCATLTSMPEATLPARCW